MNKILSDLKCKPCSGVTEKLTKELIKINLSKINNWNVNENYEMIYKKYTFKNFKNAINFANLVGKLAEEEVHHPDISIGFGYCLVMIHTHAIKGLSDNDFILASKIDLLEY